MTGPAELRKYLDEKNLTANRFALDNRLDPGLVRKLLRGDQQRVSVDMAEAIEEATEGAVSWRSWLNEKEQNGEHQSEEKDGQQE